MEIVIKENFNKLIVSLLFLVTIFYYIAVASTRFYATSKIEQGTVIVVNDSITTIVISDK